MDTVLNVIVGSNRVTIKVFCHRGGKRRCINKPRCCVGGTLPGDFSFLKIVFTFFNVVTSFFYNGVARVGSTISSIPGGTMVELATKVVVTIVVFFIVNNKILGVVQFLRGVLPFVTLLCVLLYLNIVIEGVGRLPSTFCRVFINTFGPQTMAKNYIKDILGIVSVNTSGKVFSGRTKLNATTITRSAIGSTAPRGRDLFNVFRIFISAVLVYALATLAVLADKIVVSCRDKLGTGLALSTFSAMCNGASCVLLLIVLLLFKISDIVN